MLHYVGYGSRDYYKRPIPPYERPFWEFQAVTRNRCAPVFAHSDGALRTDRLWIFPPGYAHGWTGEDGVPCEIAVFHFDDVPATLQLVCATESFLSVAISPSFSQQLSAFAVDMDSRRRASDVLLPLRARMLADRITLEVFEANTALVRSWKATLWRERDVVDSALAWYGEHMTEGMQLSDVARTVGYSEVHLRRMFLRTLGKSPRRVFSEMRQQRARYLLSNSDMRIEEIAVACGYGEVSSFTRSFRTVHGAPPTVWRRRE